MDGIQTSTKLTRWIFIAITVAVLNVGCNCLHKKQPVVYVTQDPGVPRELCKASVSDYLIEPPDILTIDAIRLLPKQPYRLQSLDTLAVQIVNNDEKTLFQATVGIDPSGELPLGPTFGTVKASDLTIEELRKAISDQVGKTFAKPLVSVDVVQLGLLQQISGEHLVGPDGKVNLGVYGQVRVAGMSVAEATKEIENHLAMHLDKPKIAVDVYGYNSKFYYVIAEGAGLGDQVHRFPCTGNETVLDAISNVEGLSAFSSKQMWIARPGRNAQGGEQILPVDWQAISKRGDVATNYQLLPGDRVFIGEDGLVAYDNHLAKKLSPIERVTGVLLLVTQTAQRMVYFKNVNGFNNTVVR